MDDQDKSLADTEIGNEIIQSTFTLDSTHEAESVALNVQNKVGSENDKMARDRQKTTS